MADDLDPYPGNLKKHEVKQTTNDPQAPYHPTFKIPAGPHPSNPNVVKAQQREPLLSDEAGWALCPWTTGRDSWEDPLRIIRDFYEDLITRGELRVVKTVEVWHPSVPEDVWREWLNGTAAEFSMLVTKCCFRNPWCPPWGLGKGVWDEEEFVVKYERLMYVCPGCGAKIIE